LARGVDSHFNDGDDIYCYIEVGVDPKKHVKPVEVRPQAVSKAPT